MNKQEIEKALQRVCMWIGGTPKEQKDTHEIYQILKKTLEQQLTDIWIPITERLPLNEERVLICADRKFDDGSIIQIRTVAMHEDGTMCTIDSGFCWGECIDFEYDEEADDYIIPEGWWEQNMYSEEFGKVDDFVTHWMPLPDSPVDKHN